MSNSLANALVVSEQALERICAALDAAKDDEERAAIAPLVGEYLTQAEGHRDEFARVLAFLDSQVDLLDREIARLQGRKKHVAATASALRDHAIHLMQVTGVTELEGAVSTLKIKRNPPKLVLVDRDAIPAEYYREKVSLEPDNALIKDRLQAGIPIPGADLAYGFRLEVK